jgi:AcrR family transcriptional regulator
LVDAAWRCAARKRLADVTVDDVCAEAGQSKGAFYGYFESRDELIAGLLEDEAAALERMLDEIEDAEQDGVERLRRFAGQMLSRAEDPARAQVRADLWAAVLGEGSLRDRHVEAAGRRRARLRGWIEQAVEQGRLREVPANAVAATLLAMSDGLLLHASLDPSGFRWENIRRAVEALLQGISTR